MTHHKSVQCFKHRSSTHFDSAWDVCCVMSVTTCPSGSDMTLLPLLGRKLSGIPRSLQAPIEATSYLPPSPIPSFASRAVPLLVSQNWAYKTLSSCSGLLQAALARLAAMESIPAKLLVVHRIHWQLIIQPQRGKALSSRMI
jgi:hypothetical protein